MYIDYSAFIVYTFGTIFQNKFQLMYHMLVIKNLSKNYIKYNNIRDRIIDIFQPLYTAFHVTKQEIVHVDCNIVLIYKFIFS